MGQPCCHTYVAAIKFSLSDVLNSNFQLRQREPLTVQYRGKVGGGWWVMGGGGGGTHTLHTRQLSLLTQ